MNTQSRGRISKRCFDNSKLTTKTTWSTKFPKSFGDLQMLAYLFPLVNAAEQIIDLPCRVFLLFITFE